MILLVVNGILFVFSMNITLIIPAFIAGLLTFFAPCTLPLVPAYLGFIGGTHSGDLGDPSRKNSIRRHVMLNGLAYVLGFSVVFILLGVIFGLGGASLVHFRAWLSRIGGVFVIFFALYMLGVFDRLSTGSHALASFRFLNSEHRWNPVAKLKPGRPTSSFLLGATFAFGWTPCVGPILGSVLLLASSTATIGQGAVLLAVYSVGLAVPFLVIAFGVGQATATVRRLSRWIPIVSRIGGLFLLFLGILLLSNHMEVWMGWAYQHFPQLGTSLLNRL